MSFLLNGILITEAVAGPTINSATSTNAFDLILHAGFVAKLVLLLLMVSSLFSWAIIFLKHRNLKSAQKESDVFLNAFWYGKDFDEVMTKSENLKKSPVANVFRAGYKEMKKITMLEEKNPQKQGQILSGGIDNIQRALNRTTTQELTLLEKYVGILATIGSAAPFVGLLGTVWGIMDSFQNIGATGNANLAVVAPGISEALIATAAGLLAAIPAVVAYNFYVGKIKTLTNEMDNFSQDFINIIQRSLLKI